MNTSELEVKINKYTKSVNINLNGMSDEEIRSMIGLFSKLVKLMEKELN